MPRFSTQLYPANLALLDEFPRIASEHAGTTQLALASLFAEGDYIIPIPGTTKFMHLAKNASAASIVWDLGTVARLDRLINQNTVEAARYPALAQTEVEPMS